MATSPTTNGSLRSPTGDTPHAIQIDPTTDGAHLHRKSSADSGQSNHIRRRGRRMTASTAYGGFGTRIVGAEPGIDVAGPEPEATVELHANCGITVVDFDETQLTTSELTNETLQPFLDLERPAWSKVRWINVNGLSWDVIKTLGQYKSLHRLAIEDLMNTKNRTKCDWYSDHTFLILTLQKLIHLHNPNEDAGHSDLEKEPGMWAKMFGNRIPDTDDLDSDIDDIPDVQGHTKGSRNHVRPMKTLQRYHGGPNTERILYMENHSSLAAKRLAVSVEQCSIFLTDDHTVISFFENSADDIEPPIMARLSSTNTLLRTACDGSMIVQAILDAIVDLAFPIIHAYQDTIGELELNVLTEPSLEHTSNLYIITSELSLLRTTLQPIVSVINALRDHRQDLPSQKEKTEFLTSVEVSSITHTYLGDVQDHCIVLLDYVETMKRSADNLTDYIFNTMGNLQNESMKQLTLVTIVFLPMSFLTGYFGMNFDDFGAIHNRDSYFWYIGAPVAFATIMFLMFGTIKRHIRNMFRKRQIKKVRKIRTRMDGTKQKMRLSSDVGAGGVGTRNGSTPIPSQLSQTKAIDSKFKAMTSSRN